MKTKRTHDIFAAVLAGTRADASRFGVRECNFRAEVYLRSVFHMAHFLLLLVFAIALTSCAQNPPQPASGKQMQLETIYHGPMRQPTYLYRDVN